MERPPTCTICAKEMFSNKGRRPVAPRFSITLSAWQPLPDTWIGARGELHEHQPRRIASTTMVSMGTTGSRPGLAYPAKAKTPQGRPQVEKRNTSRGILETYPLSRPPSGLTITLPARHLDPQPLQAGSHGMAGTKGVFFAELPALGIYIDGSRGRSVGSNHRPVQERS